MLSVWADISLLWLIFLTFITILPFGVLFFFMIKGMIRLRELAVLYLPMIQDRAKPVIGVYAKSAQVNGLRKSIFTRRQEP